MINNQIYITSLVKSIYGAKLNGKMDSKIIQLFNLYKYYIDFAKELSDNESTQFEDHIVSLKREASRLVYKYPKILCNYKVVVPNHAVNINQYEQNTAPTVDGQTIGIGTSKQYQFVVGDFLTNFADANNDSYKYLLIYPNEDYLFTGTDGTTSFSTPIVIDIEGMSANDFIDLFYIRTPQQESGSFGPIPITFRVSDNNVNYLYSSVETINISSDVAYSDNQPVADIGDNTIYASNRSTTILTLFMFTGGLTPPYNDPEGDLIDAIKIIDISGANTGTYYVNGAPIVEGQIITREEIEAGLFTHVGPDQDAISSDTFQFQARDEGSQIWVD